MYMRTHKTANYHMYEFTCFFRLFHGEFTANSRRIHGFTFFVFGVFFVFSDRNVDVYTNVVVPRVDITDTVKEC